VTTTRDLIQAGSERLRAAGSDTPRLDAELLLAHAIGVDRTAVVAHGDAPVGPGAESSYLGFIDRRATGEPIAYIRGFREFHGIVIVVDSRALIPRPETEALVDRALVEIMARLTRGPAAAGGVVGRCRVIDVGTGSGAIAVALAVALRKRAVPPDEVTNRVGDERAARAR
jgi:release factor glutamine methyltransferase